tara:strand:+ start:863 stop:1579 length:717 start_codon:yes stop_codon:yes gene_type:complete
MDPEQEFTYTMNCGGGSESSSNSDSRTADADIDRADEQQGYSEAEANAAGVDTSNDTGYGHDDGYTDGITNYTSTPAEALKTAYTASGLEPHVGIGMSNWTTAGLGALTGVPVGGIQRAASVNRNYNAIMGYDGSFVDNTPADFGGETGGSEPDNNAIMQQQMNEGNLPPSVAAKFYGQQSSSQQQGLLDSPVMQDYAKVKSFISTTANTATPIGQLAVNESPFYDFLKKYNLDKGIL